MILQKFKNKVIKFPKENSIAILIGLHCIKNSIWREMLS